MNGVPEMSEAITNNGAGNVAIAIVFIIALLLVGYMIRQNGQNNKAHREEMVPVLNALTQSNIALKETMDTLKELIVEKLSDVDHKVDLNITLLKSHMTDCNRIENSITPIHKAVVQMEERTKVCAANRRKENM